MTMYLSDMSKHINGIDMPEYILEAKILKGLSFHAYGFVLRSFNLVSLAVD